MKMVASACIVLIQIWHSRRLSVLNEQRWSTVVLIAGGCRCGEEHIVPAESGDSLCLFPIPIFYVDVDPALSWLEPASLLNRNMWVSKLLQGRHAGCRALIINAWQW